jgi:GNAT superfamily N-acetyltransferase
VLTIRPARAEDNARLAYIVFNEPDFEAVALIGDVPRARKYGYGKIALEKIPSSKIRHTVVAEKDGQIVGLLQYALEKEYLPAFPVVWLLLKSVGPIGFLRRIPKLRALRRVNIDTPEGAFNVEAVNVDPTYQGHGIGTELLKWADEEAARRHVTRMSVSTWIGYRSVGLYERDGFVQVESKRDPDYERYFGVPGRVLLVKRLSDRRVLAGEAQLPQQRD